MAENGRSGLDSFAHHLITRIVLYYIGLALAIALLWIVLPASARTEAMGVLSSLIAFRAGGKKSGINLDATGIPAPDFVVVPFQPLLVVVIAVTSAFLLAL